MSDIKTWEKRHRACLSVKDGQPFYDWTKAPEGKSPEDWPNGIVGRLLPEERRAIYAVTLG